MSRVCVRAFALVSHGTIEGKCQVVLFSSPPVDSPEKEEFVVWPKGLAIMLLLHCVLMPAVYTGIPLYEYRRRGQCEIVFVAMLFHRQAHPVL